MTYTCFGKRSKGCGGRHQSLADAWECCSWSRVIDRAADRVPRTIGDTQPLADRYTELAAGDALVQDRVLRSQSTGGYSA